MSAVDASTARDVLRDLPKHVAGFDLSELGDGDLASLLADVRTAQRCLDGFVMRIGARCEDLAVTNSSSPVEDVMRGGGIVGSRQAKLEAERARAGRTIEGLAGAAIAGETSGAHVDSIARHTAKLSDERRASFDFVDLVDKAKDLPLETFDRLVKRRVEVANGDHGLRDTEAKRAASEFRHWFDQATGMGRFSGSLDPLRYEALTNAIDQRMCALASRAGEAVTKNHNLAAQALVDLTTGGDGRSSARPLPQITVVVDQDTIVGGAHDNSIRRTENGHELPPETIARLCCDAVIRRVTLDRSGIPINVGRKYRTATDAQWAAIKTMHPSCAWDRCEAPISWCQAHHIREWENGGPTDLHNLVPLCNRHHHLVHEGRWGIELLADRSLRVLRPDGSCHTTVPPPGRPRIKPG